MCMVTLEGRAPRSTPTVDPGRVLLVESSQLIREIVTGNGLERLTIKPVDDRPFGLAKLDRVLSQGLEDGLEIERRPADDLEEVTGGRLLLEGHPELAVTRP